MLSHEACKVMHSSHALTLLPLVCTKYFSSESQLVRSPPMLDRALCPSRVCFGLPVEPLGASQLPDLDLHGLAAQAEVLHDVEISVLS